MMVLVRNNFCSILKFRYTEHIQYTSNTLCGSNLHSQPNNRYINMILNESSGIRKQDGTYVFKSVAENKYGYEIAFNFLSNEWDNLQNYFGLGFMRISLMVSFLSIYLNMQEQLDQLKMIRLNHLQHLGSTNLSLNQTIEEVTNSVAWIRTYYDEINSWLDNILSSMQFL